MNAGDVMDGMYNFGIWYCIAFTASSNYQLFKRKNKNSAFFIAVLPMITKTWDKLNVDL